MSESQSTYDRIIGPIEEQMIRSIWRIVRNREDAEDAMQETLMNAWKNWTRVSRHPNPRALVLKMCIDAAYDKTRQRFRHRRGPEPIEQADGPKDNSPIPSQAAADSEQYQRLIAEIHELPRQQAIATLMRIVQGHTYRDIAMAMNCAEATARKHVARGRERLQDVFSRMNQNDLRASTKQ